MEENISCTLVLKEVSPSISHRKEEKEMKKIVHINIYVKKTKVHSLFNSYPQANLLLFDLVSNIGLEVHNHPIPYLLEWINKDTKIKLMKQCKIKFVVNAKFIDEVESKILPFDVCGVVFGIPYMYMRDAIFK